MRVALVAGPDAGHAFPAIGLALRLRAAGHEALVVTGERWQPALAVEGLDGQVLPLLGADPRDTDFGFRLWGRGARMAVPLAEQLDGWRPDAIVADTLTVCGGFAAGLLGLPWAELLPHPLQDLPPEGPPLGLGLEPGRGQVGRARDAVLRRLTTRDIRRAGEQRAAALRSIGVDPSLAPRARLVATLPALELRVRPGAVPPPGVAVVGPLEWEPPSRALAPPPGGAPLVLVTPTTASGAPADVLTAAALTGLEGAGVRVAVTLPQGYGGPAGSASGPLPPWAVAGHGAQAPLLDAAAVVVCGAGGGILGKALRRGVPLVLVPGPGDQRENAWRVQRLGAGVVIPPRRVRPAVVAAAVRSVLSHPAYRWSARALAARGRVLDPVLAVERALAPGGDRKTRPGGLSGEDRGAD